MESVNLRAIPIAYERNVYSLNKKELDIVKKTKYRKLFNGLYLSKNTSLLENKSLASLKKLMVDKGKEYARDVLGIKDQIYLVHSWSTINPTHAFHEPHEHPNVFISLVYYAQCKDSFIRFILERTSIRECFNFDFTINKYNIYNSQTWDLPVEAGDIVIFPGHIRHASVANKVKLSRIIIGANFFIKGKIGNTKTVSHITL